METSLMIIIGVGLLTFIVGTWKFVTSQDDLVRLASYMCFMLSCCVVVTSLIFFLEDHREISSFEALQKTVEDYEVLPQNVEYQIVEANRGFAELQQTKESGQLRAIFIPRRVDDISLIEVR